MDLKRIIRLIYSLKGVPFLGTPVFIGVFRRGNKPPVLPGDNKRLQQKKNLCDIIVNGLATALLKNISRRFLTMIDRNEIRSSAHSKYRCQYHIVFAPKYRRKEIYGQLEILVKY